MLEYISTILDSLRILKVELDEFITKMQNRETLKSPQQKQLQQRYVDIAF